MLCDDCPDGGRLEMNDLRTGAGTRVNRMPARPLVLSLPISSLSAKFEVPRHLLPCRWLRVVLSSVNVFQNGSRTTVKSRREHAVPALDVVVKAELMGMAVPVFFGTGEYVQNCGSDKTILSKGLLNASTHVHSVIRLDGPG